MSVLSQFGPPVPYAALAGSVTNGVYTVGNQTIGGVKTFTSTIVGDISGNAGTATTANFATSAGSVTNGVYTIGNQTIGGIKTFSSTIVGDISGNAGTVTGGVYTTGNQTIGGTKTFSSTIVGDISGNAGTVTGGVYTTGNQTIGGIKTFSSTISGDISGNAGTVTNGVYTTGNQTIGGTKTFTLNPILSAGTANTVLVLDGSKQIAAASGLGYNATTRTLTLGVGDTPDFRIGRGAGNVSTNTAVGANSLVANTTGSNNTAFGNNALSSNTTAVRNTAIGDGALQNHNTGGHNNTGVGYNALYNGTGNNPSGNGHCTAVGSYAISNLTTGYDNTAIGTFALYSTTTGLYNTAGGAEALRSNTTGSQNTAFGAQSLFYNTTGGSNVAIGAFSLLNNSSGSANTAIGRDALNKNTTGGSNVAIGFGALEDLTTSGFNTAVGSEALKDTTGGNNTAVGFQSGGTGANHVALGAYAGGAFGGSNNIAIGYQAGYGPFGIAGNNNVILGGFSGNQHGIDIRTTSGNVVFADGGGVPRAFYNGSAETWEFRTGAAPGTVRLTIGASGLSVSGLTLTGVLSLAAGTALLPSLAGPSDPDTGMWFPPGGNTVAWSTGGTERMRISSAGAVGIGTTPGGGMKLDILGGNVNLTNATYAAYQVVSGTLTGQLSANAGGTGTIEVRAVSNHPLLLYTNNTERMRINATGEVGIGKTAASGIALDVNGIIHAGERLQLTNGFANVSLRESATGPGYRWTLVSGTGTFRLQRSANGLFTDATTPIIFDASNNVGIGTTSPGALLDVGQTGGTTVIRSLQADSGAGTFAQILAQKAGGPGVEIIVDTAAGYVGTTGVYPLIFRTNYIERMRIDSAGNVGINNSNPQYLLHLNQNGNTQVWVSATNAGTNSAGIAFENAGQRNWQIWADRTNDAMQLGHNSRGSVVLALKPGGQTRFVPLAADPTTNVQDGDVYYNSGTNKLRVRAGGAWTDLH